LRNASGKHETFERPNDKKWIYRNKQRYYDNSNNKKGKQNWSADGNEMALMLNHSGDRG